MKGIAQNTLVAIIIAVAVIAGSAGFLSWSGYFSKVSVPTTTTTLQEGGQLTTTTEPAIVCSVPYIRYGEECCLDQNNNGLCDEDEPKPDCPHECCINDEYKSKDCTYNKECINNQCVKKECLYDCCDGTTYQIKVCSSGYDCVNNNCEEIKTAKLALSIDACRTDFNIWDWLGEVTNVYGTVTNYGTKEAINVEITSTASDVGQDYYKSRGTISVLPPDSSVKFKTVIDTTEGNETIISVSATCEGCEIKSITSISSQCETDWEKVKNEAQDWIEFIGEVISPFE